MKNRMKNADIVKALEVGMTQAQIAAAITRLGVPTTQATISRIKKGAKTNSELERALMELAVERGVLAEEVAAAPLRPIDYIDEVDVRAGMGGGGLTIVENITANGYQFASEVIRDHWRLPAYMLNRFNARPQHIKAFQADGDSMEPTIENGDVVFADTRHRVPSPPGIYVLADQFGGVVVKRLEVISRPHEDPVQIRVISDNQRHAPQELTLDEINIIGRYVGRFTI